MIRRIGSVLSLLAGLGVLAFLVLCTGLFTVDPSVDWSLIFISLWGLLGIPTALVPLVIAGALDPSPTWRLVVFAFTTVLAFVGSGMLCAGATADGGLIDGMGMALFWYGLPTMLIVVGLAYNVLTTLPVLLNASHERELRAVEGLLADRGSRTLGEIAVARGTREAQARELVVELLGTGRVQGRLLEAEGKVHTEAWRAASQAHILDQVRRDGRVEVAAVARERGETEAIVRQWVYELVYEGRFTGYFRSDTGVLYAAEASVLRAGTACPACGGALELRARHVVRCRQCDTSILV